VRVRDTVLKTPDGRIAFIPNIMVFNGVVVNLSTQSVRRFEIAVWTPVGAEVEAVRLAMLAAVASTPGVLEEPAPDAQIAAVGPGRARVIARGWVDTSDTSLGVTQSAALARAHAVIAQAGVETSEIEPTAPEASEPDASSSSGE
jgi:small conductance mechanosensitive channel